MGSMNDDPSMHDIPRKGIKIVREENFGPVANPDGSPTETSLEIMGISREQYEENLRNNAFGSFHNCAFGCRNDAEHAMHHVPTALRNISVTDPDFEELDSDDWKILFMLLCENRGKLDLEAGLTDHGKRLLKAVTRKIGINAVGVDINQQ